MDRFFPRFTESSPGQKVILDSLPPLQSSGKLRRLPWQSAPSQSLPYIDRYLLQTIREQGVAESHLDALRFEGSAAMWQAAAGLAKTLPAFAVSSAPEAVPEAVLETAVAPTSSSQPRPAPEQTEESVSNFAEHCVHADSAQIVSNFPDILYWALSDRILNIVEAYLGCPPALIGTALRKDKPDGQQAGTRLWHLDGEDHKVFKIFVYLNDVGAENGPFEYVPRSRFNPTYRRFSLKHRRFWRNPCRNQDFARIIDPQDWRSATGPAGTILFSDTANVFHHGAIAHSGERLMLIFAYTSQQPIDVPLARQFFPSADLLPSLAPNLSPRQRDCLLSWRG